MHPVVHILQHGCFFGSALAYWWTVVGGRARISDGDFDRIAVHDDAPYQRAGRAADVCSVAVVQIGGARAFGLSALEDQQLGGLIMWVPGGMAYMIVGLMIVGRWLAPPQVPVKT